MACDIARERLTLYLDGELDGTQAESVATHLRQCSSCAANALEHVQLKRSVALAGRRYPANEQLRHQIMETMSSKPSRAANWYWRILAAPAVLVLLASVAVNWYVARESARRDRVYSELADLHVSTLASSTPVDVVSSDRHTVKPWFQGRIPFTFNLPELQGSEFALLGGRVTYLAQSPGAELLYQIRKHDISVFIFPASVEAAATLPSGPVRAKSFNVESWTQNGLRYFVVGDVGNEDIEALSKLLQSAG